MLIPSIDLQGGRIVQLVQGERLALGSDDVDGWIEKFSRFPAVQLIDLDAAKGGAGNEELVAYICARLPCRLGGGLRTRDRVLRALDLGATKAIVGSSLYKVGGVDVAFASEVCNAVGAARLIAAVDAKGGRIAINGWRTLIDLTPIAAVALLEPFVDEFLFTNVDVEGLMRGMNRDAIAELRASTAKTLTAAGGVTTREDIAWLDSLGVHAVAGMAIYTGVLDISFP
jgi:phosphoribosylformimino-5-aminoimidazole carboxamide ribotide isomerase